MLNKVVKLEMQSVAWELRDKDCSLVNIADALCDARRDLMDDV